MPAKIELKMTEEEIFRLCQQRKHTRGQLAEMAGCSKSMIANVIHRQALATGETGSKLVADNRAKQAKGLAREEAFKMRSAHDILHGIPPKEFSALAAKRAHEAANPPPPDPADLSVPIEQAFALRVKSPVDVYESRRGQMRA